MIRIKKIILTIISIIIIVLVLQSNKTENYIIPKEAIRFRVIANSNNEKDQAIKYKVKNNIQYKLNTILSDTKTIDKARDKIANNVSSLDKTVALTLKKENIHDPYTINFGYNYFPEKEYKNVIYQEGEYESLVITLGRGQGNNWWCVMFPPICAVEEDNNEPMEYKSIIKNIFDKYILKSYSK